MNFLIAGYGYSEGDLSTPAASPIKDAQLTINTEVLAYARSLDVMGHAAKFDMVVPYSELSGHAQVNGARVEREINGFHDPRFRFSFLFYGAPALSLKEFQTYEQDLIIGGSVQVSAPLGQYDDARLVNLGANRWYVRPDLGISKAWGAFAAELSTGVYLFTDNDDFFGGKKLEQEPLYSSQIHLTYTLKPGMWVALSGNVDQGGRTQVNGVWSDDKQNNSRAGATFAVSVNKNHSIKTYFSTLIHTNIGGDYDLYGIAWQYRWGQGF
jgi:hypothetical protein